MCMYRVGGGAGRKERGPEASGAEVRQPAPIPVAGDSNRELEQGGDPSPKAPGAWGPEL